MTNNYIAPKVGDYKLDIIDKTINEIILTYTNKNINDLVEIMNEFPLNKYSRKLTGSDLYLWEA
tara:strand:- start:1175 stop:1366 length:192 start_codon:yes stop_codon:yes gene_type:complete